MPSTVDTRCSLARLMTSGQLVTRIERLGRLSRYASRNPQICRNASHRSNPEVLRGIGLPGMGQHRRCERLVCVQSSPKTERCGGQLKDIPNEPGRSSVDGALQKG